MPKRTPTPGQVRRAHPSSPAARWLKRLVACAIILATLGSAAAFVAYREIGKTPGELLDYADRRLQGHPRLEVVAAPAFAGLRTWFGESAIADRRLRAFVVPPPPTLIPFDKDAAAPPAVPAGRVLRVGPQQLIRSMAVAAQLAKDGDTVEIEAGDYRDDVIATWTQKQLTIRGLGTGARLFAQGNAAEGKALWVIRNGNFDISNIGFIGTKVEDGNGAGIRFEGGHLRVKNCLFWGNQTGLLTIGEAPTAALEIESSEFGYNGIGDGLTHNLYVGKIGRLKVTGSYFHHVNVGHLLKSRAARSEVLYNRITDESGGRASYELDFPNGGDVLVKGNLVQQNEETENSTIISYGFEGYAWPRNKLYLLSNTLVNDKNYGGAFLRVAPKADGVFSANNLFVGNGKNHAAQDIQSFNDATGGWELFIKASRHDYRLAARGREFAFRPPTFQIDIEGASPAPEKEYVHRGQARALPKPAAYAGAQQSE